MRDRKQVNIEKKWMIISYLFRTSWSPQVGGGDKDRYKKRIKNTVQQKEMGRGKRM